MSDFAKGGLVKGPSGEDTVPVMIGREEHWLTADQVLKLTEETRGGEEAFDWRVSPDAIRHAEEQAE